MRCKVVYYTIYHDFETKFFNADNLQELWEKAQEYYYSNEDLQRRVREYMQKHHPDVKVITVGLGIGDSFTNPKRIQKKLKF